MADAAGARGHPFPARLGKFELLAPLGVGGMATVFLARGHGPHGFERHVALKLMHPHLSLDASWTRQFVTEAKIAAGIAHPNVVAVTDFGEEDNGLYLVMDYVEGDSLSGLMKEAAARSERVPMGVALRILVDALAGLHAAHELRDGEGRDVALVHRDFSPQNVLVGTDGVARLTDFGIAKTTLGDRTHTGLVKGKLVYMSPEQVSGQPLDRRSDVWAAGIVAWELVTGQRLYAAQDEMATALRVVSSTPPRARSICADVPQWIDETIAAALEPRRELRIATADALRNRLLEAGNLADAADVARYVAHAAAPRVAVLRGHTGSLSATRARAVPLETLPHAEAATITTVSWHTKRAPPAYARGRSRRLLLFAALGVCGMAAVGVTELRRFRSAAVVNMRPAAAIPHALPTSEGTTPADTTAARPSTEPAPSASTVVVATPAPSVRATAPVTAPPRVPARRSTHVATPTTVSPTSQLPIRKRLLGDPLDAPP